MSTDGSWLRIEPSCRKRPRRRRRQRAVLARVSGAAVLVAGLAVLVVPAAETGASDPVRSTSPARADTAASAAVSVPQPPPDLAASFEHWAHEYGIPVPLLEALTWHESRWQPTAVSHAGAIGLGQLMPATAAALEAQIGEDLDPWNADDNVRMSALLLSTLHSSAAGDLSVALAGYAQSASSVAREGMWPSTRQYVDEILALYDTFRANGA
jgi:soluble lytic murein transglycosylase-like protein